nr:cell wall-binding repeat-containing protein [Salirhabdus salicampi]
MHKRGIKVVPFLANHWDRTAGINGLNNREQLARDIANAIEQYNLDGVNVDIEGVGHTYRNEHTDLVRLLREYIPKHKEVSVAVAANPSGWNTGWHGFYDYKGLAQHSDYLMIMAYDESWDSPDSPIGPVSSLSFFERSIQYAINQGIPRTKIVAGLPFYGRMWKLDGPTLEGRNLHGMGLSSTRVEPLVNQFNGRIQFDEKTQSSYASFTIPEGQSAFIGSTKLTEGSYIIWYENEPSIRAKLQMPGKYGIKGTGSWALMHETPNTWDYYTSALNTGNSQPIATNRFRSGPMAVTTTDNLNLRETASLSGTIIRTLSNKTLLKVTGDVITADNTNWVPVQLQDGTSGFVSSSFLKRFSLQELYGKNRFETSTNVSKHGWPESASTVVLGRGDVPIDALTGSVLAKKTQSPLLLTNSSNLPTNVEDEIDRLQPSRIYILGGQGAISDTVQSHLQGKGYNVTRIAGSNRYETAVRVASEIGNRNEIILTTGRNSPDALSVAPYAGQTQTPILLTDQKSLPNEVAHYIQTNGINSVTIIGGEGAVSNNVITQLQNLGVPNIERIAGKDRYETSVAIAQRFKNEFDLSNIYFASGISFIDALPGSPLAAMQSSPIILINNANLPPTVESFLQNELPGTPNVNILGGYGVISDATRANVFRVLR